LVGLLIGARILTFLMQFQQSRYIYFQYLIQQQIEKFWHSLTGIQVIDQQEEEMTNLTIVQSKERENENKTNEETHSNQTPSASAASVTVVVNNSSTNSTSGLYLVWREIELTLKGSNKVLVSGVTGFAPSGSITAIMGPSGAGMNYDHSSLLDLAVL
jgi:hypothetical protein